MVEIQETMHEHYLIRYSSWIFLWS